MRCIANGLFPICALRHVQFLKKANLDVQLRLEETTREGRLKEQALTALLEGQKVGEMLASHPSVGESWSQKQVCALKLQIQMSSLEKELAEAHDSHATGSSAKAEETEKTRRKLEEALARSAQVSENDRNRPPAFYIDRPWWLDMCSCNHSAQLMTSCAFFAVAL